MKTSNNKTLKRWKNTKPSLPQEKNNPLVKWQLPSVPKLLKNIFENETSLCFKCMPLKLFVCEHAKQSITSKTLKKMSMLFWFHFQESQTSCTSFLLSGVSAVGREKSTSFLGRNNIFLWRYTQEKALWDEILSPPFFVYLAMTILYWRQGSLLSNSHSENVLLPSLIVCHIIGTKIETFPFTTIFFVRKVLSKLCCNIGAFRIIIFLQH